MARQAVLLDELCARLGCADATAIGIGRGCGDEQVASLRRLLCEVPEGGLVLGDRFEPARLHLVIGSGAAEAAERAMAGRRGAMEVYVALPSVFGAAELAAAIASAIGRDGAVRTRHGTRISAVGGSKRQR